MTLLLYYSSYLADIVEADKIFDRFPLVRRDVSIIAVEPYTIQIENFDPSFYYCKGTDYT